MSITTRNLGVQIDNVKEFQDTRNISRSEFIEETELLEANTEAYTEPSKIEIVGEGYKHGEVKFTNGGTVSTAYSYAKKYRVAMLNFANALTPGGGVLSGSSAQEENICRCTNLYESLTTPIAIARYYNRNEQMLKVEPRYTDTLVYSPGVIIFKDDIDYKRIPPLLVDVITCPAPMGGATDKMEDLLKRRMEGIVKSAIYHGVDVLILGAWGCGVFLQDPVIMARLFGEVLKKYSKYFEVIDFAIRNNDTSKNSSLLKTFEVNFKEGYGK